jgi:hypothetical protein
MKIWEERDISDKEVGRRARALQRRIIDLLQEPANLGPVRQFCRLVMEMGVYANVYTGLMVREVARGRLPETYLWIEAEEAKKTQRKNRKRMAYE